MFTLFRWIIALPLCVGAVLFGISHRQIINFTYSPFHPPIDIPLYWLGLGLCALGLLIGCVTTWIALGPLRAKNRTLKKTVKQLEKERDNAKASNENTPLKAKDPDDRSSQNLLRY